MYAASNEILFASRFQVWQNPLRNTVFANLDDFLLVDVILVTLLF